MSALLKIAGLMTAFLVASLVNTLFAASQNREAVDIELVLAVDTSNSMDSTEQIIQRDGYVAAFQSSEVIKVILSGYHKKIAVTYLEWGGAGYQQVVVPWMVIDSPASAIEFASKLAAPTPVRSDRTSISNALITAKKLLDQNRFEGIRRVVDVSGDGPNNDGPYVNLARNYLIENGIVINGLPILAKPTYLGFGIDKLDIYYQECVIGGHASFMIPVYDWSEFPKAIKKKIVLELSHNFNSENPEFGRFNSASSTDNGSIPLVYVNTASSKSYNCQTGEETWKKFHMDWKHYNLPPPD